jgi:hypothetical protein
MAVLQSAQLVASLQWTAEYSSGLNTVTAQGPLRGTVTPTVGDSAANEIYFSTGTLAAGASVTIDLRAVTEPQFNRALTPSGAYLLLVKGTGATWRYTPGASNPLNWFIAGTNPQLNFNAGDTFAAGSTTAATINATTRNVTLSNTHGSDTLTYTIAVVLKTA